MTHHLLAAGLALALAAAAQPSHAALPPGISGAWYNPAQPGHGIAVEMIGGQRSDAFWFVYDRAGNPLHLYLVGEVEGESIHYTAFENRGMRFGSFDPAERTESAWGSVTLAFHNCAEATLSWQAADPDYAHGSMPLVRLTGIEGLPCALAADPALLPAGAYGAWIGDASGDTRAAVDRSGRLWATSTITPSSGFVGNPTHVVTGVPTGTLALAASKYVNSGASNLPDTQPVHTFPLEFDPRLDGTLMAQGSAAWVWEDPLAPSLVRSFDPASLAGATFVYLGRSQFFLHDRTVRFLDDGRFCIDHSAPCVLEGQVGAVEPGLAMFAFTATGKGQEWSGMAWLAHVDGREELVLVGSSDVAPSVGAGVGLVGVRQ